MRNGSSIRDFPRPPVVPGGCASCPIRAITVCRPFVGVSLEIVQRFKLGDRLLPAGRELFTPGDELTEIYNLLDGWVALYHMMPDGRRQIIDFALPGAFLGYQPDLEAPIQFGAECLTDIAVCVFPRHTFHNLGRRYPAMWMQLANIKTQSLMRARAMLANMGSRSALERTAHLLYDIASRLRAGETASLAGEFDVPLTQTHIGEALGLSSVYVNKTLRELRERGILTLKGHRLTVLDPVRLGALADPDPPPEKRAKRIRGAGA